MAVAPIKIGVLAGMGPRSTSPFLESVLDACQQQYGAVYDIDFPHMHIYALPTPFYPKRAIDGAAMREALTVGIQGLCLAKVDFIVVPCNSAHPYFDTMQAASNVPVLNMIDLTLSALSSKSTEINSAADGSKNSSKKPSEQVAKMGSVAVVATRQTMISGLYTQPLADAGIAYEANDLCQTMIDDLLVLRKKEGLTDAVLGKWRELLGVYLKAGVTQILVACTDLGFIAEHAAGLTVVDSSQVLAQETIKYYLTLSRENGTLPRPNLTED